MSNILDFNQFISDLEEINNDRVPSILEVLHAAGHFRGKLQMIVALITKYSLPKGNFYKYFTFGYAFGYGYASINRNGVLNGYAVEICPLNSNATSCCVYENGRCVKFHGFNGKKYSILLIPTEGTKENPVKLNKSDIEFQLSELKVFNEVEEKGLDNVLKDVLEKEEIDRRLNKVWKANLKKYEEEA